MHSDVPSRIRFLDGLRGLAIGWVVLFHALVRWPEVVPFGSRFVGISWLENGRLGVQLFFLISGFVICMTLEKTPSFRDFIVRRWLRLMPAMLAASAILFLSAPLVPERPAGLPVLPDLLPGLSLIEPTLWVRLLGRPQGMLEGAFWSLFVEVKFYLIAGSLYFLFGMRYMLVLLFSLFFCTAVAVFVMRSDAPILDVQRVITVGAILDSIHFGWFTAGALFFRYEQTKAPWYMVCALGTAFLAAFFYGWGEVGARVFPFLMATIFACGVGLVRFRALLSARIFLFFGAISYPLYLVHENLMVALIAKLGSNFPQMPILIMVLLPLLVVVCLAWLISRFAEPFLKNMLRHALSLIGISAVTQKRTVVL